VSRRADRPWLNYLLSLACVGAIVVAYFSVGRASSTASTGIVVTATRGVVQSTVSGSGTIEAASQFDLGFATSGVVTHVYVKQGDEVAQGELLATLDPRSVEVTVEQAKATLQAAEATLAQEEENAGETSNGSPSAPVTTQAGKTAAASSSSGGSTTSAKKQSAATREANLASAQAAVKSDRLSVESDEQAVQATKLYAPHDGTIVSLSGEAGETVSASGTTKVSAASASSGSGGTSTGSSSGTGTSTGRTGATSAAAGSSGGSSSTGSSSSGSFAVLSDLTAMQLVVPLSESEIGSVKQGQTATVTVEALKGRKLAAHVAQVATLATTSSGVVSYDVSFQLDQLMGGLKPGMSASAEVVVKQGEGVSVPTAAISGGVVTVVRGDKRVSQPVTTGLAGNSSTLILDGLKAGEQVVLPVASTTSSGLGSRLGGRGGALGGGLGGGAALGGGAFRVGGGGAPGG
jgi:multidrug efflux pump subunit AcrA (membrane-fusion protein)